MRDRRRGRGGSIRPIRPIAPVSVAAVAAVAVAMALIALVTAAPAGAVGWVTGAPVSPAGRVAKTPMIALTPSGERIVAWEQLQLGSSTPEGIGVRIAPPGGDFGPVQVLGDASEFAPSLATGADGTAALVWASGDGLHIARRAPGQSTFTDLAPFTAPVSIFSTRPRVAVQDGAIYVTFATRLVAGDIVETSIEAVRVAPGATRATLVSGIGAGGALDSATYDDATQPAVTVDAPDIGIASGAVHVVWEELDAGVTSSTIVKRAAVPLSGGTFVAPVPVDTNTVSSTSPEPATPRLAIGAGRADVAWARNGHGQIGYQELTAGGPERTITFGGFVQDLHATIDSSGALLFAWDQRVAPDFADAVWETVAPPGGSAAPPQRLTPPNADRALDDLVGGANGGALSLPDRVTDNISADEQVQASFRATGGAFGTLEEVSGPQDRPGDAANAKAAAAIGADGRTLAAWSANDGSGVTNARIFISERDATPPSIDSVTVPGSAAPGAVVAMSAASSDALSPPVAIDWDFGDGAANRGGSVSHAYAAPGTYTVTVKATDASGNTTTQTRSIAIASTPDLTPPTITAFRTAHTRFTVARGAFAFIAAKAKRKPKPKPKQTTPSGTVFTLSLTERANLILSFAGRAAGRRSGVGCVVSARRGRLCTVSVTPGVVIRAARGPGIVSIPFSGRIGSSALLPGSYVVTARAIDAAGSRSQPRAASFTVVVSR